MARRVLVFAVLSLLVVAALPAPAGAAVPRATVSPPDPPGDVLGWEAGYWYNESIPVDQSDGLDAAEIEAVVARTMARVEHIRRLEFNETVPVSTITREELRRRGANRTTPEALRTFDNAKFEALFLVNESTDSIAVQEQNRGTGILGYYDTAADEIVLVGANGSRRVDEPILAHELVHALQDQHFNLSRYRARTRDEVNAQNGIIEGDPSYVEYRYRTLCEGAWSGTCLSPSSERGSSGTLANIGVYLLKYQPYSDGAVLVQQVRERGGWEAVNAVYEHPPESTEQVIHPQRYRVDAPTLVGLGDRTTDDWERVRPPGRPDYATVGEAALFTMLWYPGYDSARRTEIIPYTRLFNFNARNEVRSFDPYNYVHRYSEGWDGDRMHVYRNDDNETAYVWRLVWDTSADAAEFRDGYRQLLQYWGAREVAPDTYRIDEGGFADAFHVNVRGRTVTVVNAPSVDELRAVRRNLTLTPSSSTTPAEPPTFDDPSTPPSLATDDGLDTPDVAVSPTASETPDPTGPASTPGQPGFGMAVAALAVLVALLVRRR